MDRRCDSEVYGEGRGSHPLAERYFTLTYPRGVVKRFCDSDCLRLQLELEHAQFDATLQADMILLEGEGA